MTWFTVNKVLNKNLKHNNDISETLLHYTKVTNPTQIANIFNHYFVNIGNETGPQIPKTDLSLGSLLGKSSLGSMFMLLRNLRY